MRKRKYMQTNNLSSLVQIEYTYLHSNVFAYILPKCKIVINRARKCILAPDVILTNTTNSKFQEYSAPENICVPLKIVLCHSLRL